GLLGLLARSARDLRQGAGRMVLASLRGRQPAGLADHVGGGRRRQERVHMVALGSGWGRWLVTGAQAAQQKGLPFHLVGVEAEPTHYRWMMQHFHDNRIDPLQHELLQAAASSQNGEAWFYFGKADPWYG